MAMYALLGNTENICFLCSIVNKMLVYEVCKLVFTFYTVSQLLVICIVLRTYTFEAQTGYLYTVYAFATHIYCKKDFFNKGKTPKTTAYPVHH